MTRLAKRRQYTVRLRGTITVDVSAWDYKDAIQEATEVVLAIPLNDSEVVSVEPIEPEPLDPLAH